MREKILNSLLAGVAISIGGYAFLKAENRVVGSVLFSIGLMLVCVMGYSLYTGKICFALSARMHPGIYGIIMTGNFAAAFIMGKIRRYASPALIERANKICVEKAYLGGKIIPLGMLCNMLIYYAVKMFKKCGDPVGRYLGMIMCITVFVYCGFEHCVADVYYFSVADYISQSFGIVLLAVIGNTLGGLLINAAHIYRKR